MTLHTNGDNQANRRGNPRSCEQLEHMHQESKERQDTIRVPTLNNEHRISRGINLQLETPKVTRRKEIMESGSTFVLGALCCQSGLVL